MFILGHAAAGALIGQQLGANPLLIFILSLASHFLLDVIPHGDRHHIVDYFQGKKEKLQSIYNVLLIDSATTIALVAILLGFTALDRFHMAWGIIGAVIPDMIVGLSEISKNRVSKAFAKFHFAIHDALIHKIIIKPLPGAIGQFLVIVAMLASL